MELMNKSLSMGHKTQSINLKKILALLGLAFFLGAAFFFSAQPGYISSLQSGEILAIVHRLGFESVTVYFIRQLAHFTLFGFIAASFVFVFSFKLSGIKLLLSSFLISTFMGMLNEMHQSLIPGRIPDVKDVITNTSGALLGAIVFTSIISIIKISKSKNFKL